MRVVFLVPFGAFLTKEEIEINAFALKLIRVPNLDSAVVEHKGKIGLILLKELNIEKPSVLLADFRLGVVG